MKKNHRLLLAGTAAALSFSLTAAVQAQNASSVVRSTDSDVNSTTLKDRVTDATSATSTDAQMAISKVNKASSLIGMDVRNAQNEKLGEIKDLVVDLHSGKVGYAVLSVGGFLGIGDKYIAVPPGAFTVAPDQQRVVLNADKARIQNAPGFAKSSWPDVNATSWNSDAAYWLSDATAQGTAASTRSGTASSSVLDNTHANTHLDSDTTRSATSSSSTTPSSTLNSRTDHSGVSATDSRDQFRGRITAINPETRTMTVEGPSGTRQFKFTETPAITLKDNRNPRLSDLKVGYPVAVGYHEDNGTYVAHSVIRSDAPEVR